MTAAAINGFACWVSMGIGVGVGMAIAALFAAGGSRG